MSSPSTHLLIAAAFVVITSNTTLGQAQLLQRNFSGGVYNSSMYSYQEGWTYSIFTQPIQKELEIVGDQVEKINKIRADFYKAQQELSQNLYKNGVPDALARAEHSERIADLREKMTKNLTKELLPHQIQRAKEVWLQNQMRNRGGASAFASASVRELLDITPEQYERMVKKSTELNAEIMKKYQEMRAEAAQELMKVLSPEQRKKLEELSGPKYEPVVIDYRKQYEERRAAQQKEQEKKRAANGKK